MKVYRQDTRTTWWFFLTALTQWRRASSQLDPPPSRSAEARVLAAATVSTAATVIKASITARWELCRTEGSIRRTSTAPLQLNRYKPRYQKHPLEVSITHLLISRNVHKRPSKQKNSCGRTLDMFAQSLNGWVKCDMVTPLFQTCNSLGPLSHCAHWHSNLSFPITTGVKWNRNLYI